MEALRQIPPVNDVLRSPELDAFREMLSQPFATAILQEVFADTRREVSDSHSNISRQELTGRIAREVARRLQLSMQPSLRRVINASGVILHTNLGRAPLPEAAIDHLREVSTGYSNLEFDLDGGKRGKRDVHVGRALQQLLGCEAAAVVNNNAAAVLLVLNTLGEGGEVIVSRGELVEIGESFRIPDIMSRSGALLREVGTTNRTSITDYEKAIGSSTRLLLRVHPSNFRMIGFTERPSLDEFIALGRRRNIPSYEDLGSGCLADTAPIANVGEPSAMASIQAGIDLVSFSGDKLLGGPQAGIIAGKRLFIEKVRRNPLFRALRVDKLTISILEYVLGAHLRGDFEAIPTWKMLRLDEMELRSRAENFVRRAGPCARLVQTVSIVGGGSAPEVSIPSWAVALELPGKTANEIEEELRRSTPPVIARVHEGTVVMDFRTVFTTEEAELLTVIQRLIR
jgi:L-seryl-tRNA(Ser) seleniumtransferase